MQQAGSEPDGALQGLRVIEMGQFAAGPQLGAHDHAALRALLGLDAARPAALQAAGVIGRVQPHAA